MVDEVACWRDRERQGGKRERERAERETERERREREGECGRSVSRSFIALYVYAAIMEPVIAQCHAEPLATTVWGGGGGGGRPVSNHHPLLYRVEV